MLNAFGTAGLDPKSDGSHSPIAKNLRDQFGAKMPAADMLMAERLAGVDGDGPERLEFLG